MRFATVAGWFDRFREISFAQLQFLPGDLSGVEGDDEGNYWILSILGIAMQHFWEVIGRKGNRRSYKKCNLANSCSNGMTGARCRSPVSNVNVGKIPMLASAAPQQQEDGENSFRRRRKIYCPLDLTSNCAANTHESSSKFPSLFFRITKIYPRLISSSLICSSLPAIKSVLLKAWL